ncbi:MAG TPA: hypothetical protein C5S50_00390 [Methanosarcinaceae archaeon]|nr:hypothetical protein [Methanosarcinaceae archaeon]
MKLNEEDVELFFKLSGALLFYTNQKYPVTKNLKEPVFKDIPPADIKSLYERLSSHTELIDYFVDENPFSFTQEELEIVKSWNNLVKGKFMIMFYLRDYTAFMSVSNKQKVYGVISLQDKIRDVIPPSLPQYVETILLPFRGKIIYCGYIYGYDVRIDENLKRILKEWYHQARRKFGIITSLDESTSERTRK